jgi:uncharacterized protein YjbJ (UPF0337 family)
MPTSLYEHADGHSKHGSEVLEFKPLANAGLTRWREWARRIEMNQHHFERKWKRVKGAVMQRWGNLTDDDPTVIDGTKGKLISRLRSAMHSSNEQQQNQVTKGQARCQAESRHCPRAAGPWTIS